MPAKLHDYKKAWTAGRALQDALSSARLGEAQESLSEAAKVPRSASQVYALRLLTSYEIAGARKKAVEMAGPSLNRASLQNLIKDHPDLGGLWQDPQFQAALQPARKL